MAIPSQAQTMTSLLKFLGDEEEHPSVEAVAHMCEEFNLGDDEREKRLRNGKRVIDYRVARASARLACAGLIIFSAERILEITREGIKVLEEYSVIDTELVKRLEKDRNTRTENAELTKRFLIYAPFLALGSYLFLVLLRQLPPYSIEALLAIPFEGHTWIGVWLLRVFIVIVAPIFLLITGGFLMLADYPKDCVRSLYKRLLLSAIVITFCIYPLCIFFRIVPPYDLGRFLQIPLDYFGLSTGAVTGLLLLVATAAGVGILVFGALPFTMFLTFIDLFDTWGGGSTGSTAPISSNRPRFPANDGWQEAQRKAWERDRERRMERR